ncbi:S-adenosyl methyltransferase [Nocardia tenerifensis]|uniref:S-adenosyl methyltransferase n=1 Tax=Nocardia tenerifensis TaxID=228006 RepID=A0A318KPJ5_9NOCA|nr:SAM-dependent methyltransferase [Nocardia tenerifensis]PXX71580.1 S-adenosyl methyltransferase [Nocardia tenerifensis]
MSREPAIRTDIPHSARIWNYWMGGKDNYEIDRVQPVAVMFMGVLGHVATYDDARRVVSTVLDGVPSGSYLLLYDGTTDDEGYVALCAEYTKSGGVPYHPRTREEVAGYFDGLEMVEPGFVSITQWRPENPDVGAVREIGAYCAVARKP